MTKLSTKHLYFGYEQRPLLQDINIEVRAGEMLALIGPNGCGKTTLLKNLSGVLTPQRGEVLLDGQPLQQRSPATLARIIAALEQHLQPGFAFTVEEIVSMGRLPYLSRLHGLGSKDKEIVEEMMALTGITPLRHRTITQLSSGERQRAWLAMALAQEPKILLLDEPTSHLDLNYQIEMLDLLQTLARNGLAIVISIHELHLIGQYADRIALLHAGKLLDIGPPPQILTETHIAEAFGVHVRVIHDPESHAILGVLPRKQKSSKPS